MEHGMNQQLTIQIQVNGEAKPVPAGLSLLELLHLLGINEKRVAVEWNRQIVRPDGWTATQVADGDEIEVVHFVGGGSGCTIPCGSIS